MKAILYLNKSAKGLPTECVILSPFVTPGSGRVHMWTTNPSVAILINAKPLVSTVGRLKQVTPAPGVQPRGQPSLHTQVLQDHLWGKREDVVSSLCGCVCGD